METAAPDSQALPPGTRIEEFVIERVLGAGGFGMTYLARDARLGRQVVIKENLPAQFCFRDPSSLTVAPRHTHADDMDNFRWSLENFSKEAAMLASLDHPGIVKVLRSFEAFGTAYFVMPFVEGVALDELAKARAADPFLEEELRKLLERVLAALGYLHDRGIYHRDIKPGNILIINDGIPVLIDFGSARQRLSDRSMTVVESAGYTPFEQLQSRGNVGPWSDLYSLGATLVKVVTGEAPPKAMDRMRKDPFVPMAERAELGSRFSKDFLRTLDQALAVDEDDRWQEAGKWLGALNHDAKPMTPPPVKRPTGGQLLSNDNRQTATEPARHKGKRKHVAVVAVAVVCLLAGAFAWASHRAEINRLAEITRQEKQRQAEAVARDAELRVAQLMEAKTPAEAEAAKTNQEKQLLIEQARREADERKEPKREEPPVAEKEEIISDPGAATKKEPFVNSLGMKFVPVPVTTGPSKDKRLLFSIWETRRKDYAAFAATNSRLDPSWEKVTTKGEPVGHEDDHPVVCVNWEEAHAFCAWLTETERAAGRIGPGDTYRLPSDIEWSFAVGIGELEDANKTPEEKAGKITDVFPWGKSKPSSGVGNYGSSLRTDTHNTTSPVGSFEANDLGIHDLGGNVWEMCEQQLTANEVWRGLRGASWGIDRSDKLLSSYRGKSMDTTGHFSGFGFRCVLVMTAMPVKPEKNGAKEIIEKRSLTGSKAGEERDFEIAPGVRITMCWIPPGEFLMGSPEGEEGRLDNETQHRVTISKGFWLAKTETTQAQWQAVMGSNPSYLRGDGLPVESLSWNDIAAPGGFIDKVNRSMPTEGWRISLPTEAQWEYACRAGTSLTYAGDLEQMAWYANNSDKRTHPVGRKKANAWGLHDMHGNLWEWCMDRHGDYPSGAVTDPQGAASGTNRLLRGGSWHDSALYCRAAYRYYYAGGTLDLSGFRVAFISVP